MEAISRQEARIASRLRRAEARFDILFKDHPRGAGSQPAAPSQGATAPEAQPEPAPEPGEPAQPAPAPAADKPVLQNEANSQPPVFATRTSQPKPAVSDLPIPNPPQDPEKEIA
jgi:hypothetical protein